MESGAKQQPSYEASVAQSHSTTLRDSLTKLQAVYEETFKTIAAQNLKPEGSLEDGLFSDFS